MTTRSTEPRGPELEATLARIQGRATRVELRLRAARVIGLVTGVLPLTLLLAAAVIVPHKIYDAELTFQFMVVSLIVLGGATSTLLLGAFFYPLPPNAGALALDEKNKLAGRLTNAIEFAAVPKAQRTDMMQLAIEDACVLVADRPAEALRTREAAPLFASLVLPPQLLAPATAVGAGALFLALWLYVPKPPPPPPPPAPVTASDAVEMTEDDLDDFRDSAKELEKQAQTPEMKVAVEKFNRLIEDLADKRLDQVEALKQIQALENELLANAEEDRKKLEEELASTAKDLEKSELAKDVAEALKKNDLKKAQEEMEKLAERVKKGDVKKDKAALEKLRDAMKKASERRKEIEKQLEERRAELQEQLLKKKKQIEQEKDAAKREEEEKLLKKKERELERLQRDSQRQASANRQLSKLDRELAQAAQDLLRELGLTEEDLQKASEDLQKAAEDLERMDQDGMTEQQKEELKKKLEELRELIKKQEKGGQGARDRLKDFSERSRGGKPGQEGPEGNEPGKGKKGRSGKEGEGDDGKGEGEGEGKGGKKPGQGEGEGEGEGDQPGLSIGKGGQGGIEIPLPGQGQGKGGDKPGPGGGKGGKEWGTGAGPDVQGDATSGQFGTLDVEQQGLETNQGPTRSKTIRQAAEKGFKGTDYEQVFKQYKTHAEESIRKENIPDGYRFYVQRYFQLIRPRD
jgi:hypothetical protein